MYTHTIYIAEDGTEFNTIEEAIAYEQPWLTANDMLEEGKNLLEIFAVLEPERQWSTKEEKILQNITKDTKIYYRSYKAIPPPLKIHGIHLDGKIGLMGEDKNSGQVWSARDLIKQILQFQPRHNA